MTPQKTIFGAALLFLFFFETIGAQGHEYFPGSPDYVVSFFESHVTTASRASATHHVPVSIMLASAALESGYGLAGSPVIQECYNLFNIKTWDETDPTCCMDVVEFAGDSTFVDAGACFRKYYSPDESFWDYCELLSTSRRFRALTQIPRWDYRLWATGLYEAGYASDPAYSDKLISIIERYGLWRFDPIPCPHPYPEIEAKCETHNEEAKD